MKTLLKRAASLALSLVMVLTAFVVPTDTAYAAGNHIPSVEITVDEPKAGEKPAETVTVSGASSVEVESVEWYDPDLDADGCFQPGREYVLQVILRVKEGDSHDFLNTGVTVNGQKAYYSVALGADYKRCKVQEVFQTEAVVSKGKVAIKNADGFLAMQNNPAGSYYLAKDITLPKNTQIFQNNNTPFTGTLDGKGHKIKNYTIKASKGGCYSLFGNMKDATVKNLTLSNVNISVSTDDPSDAAALVMRAIGNCKFTSIKVTGKVNVNYRRQASEHLYTDCSAAGLAGSFSGKMTKCTNTAKITLKCGDYYGIYGGANAAGLVCSMDGTLISCKNTGAVTVDVSRGLESVKMGGVVASADSSKCVLSKCSNSGKIKCNYAQAEDLIIVSSAKETVVMGGVAGYSKKNVSCTNTGTVTATVKNCGGGCSIGGVAGYGWSYSKCANRAKISFSGDANDSFFGGVAGSASATVSECYNTGSISAKYLSNSHVAGCDCCVGGVVGRSYGSIKNNYNTGAVSASGTGGGYAGGIIGLVDEAVSDRVISYNYNTGTVKCALRFKLAGSIMGMYVLSVGEQMNNRSDVKYNYYTSSAPLKGGGSTEPVYQPKNNSKVSTISAGSCPKLSSKYWVSGKGRLILKNNKEP